MFVLTSDCSRIFFLFHFFLVLGSLKSLIFRSSDRLSTPCHRPLCFYIWIHFNHHHSIISYHHHSIISYHHHILY
uniref:Putative ovule protein n=1 Tax=Solanum chacoense TaxID=4108 RepID=A0A0V0H303_SOLCH